MLPALEPPAPPVAEPPPAVPVLPPLGPPAPPTAAPAEPPVFAGDSESLEQPLAIQMKLVRVTLVTTENRIKPLCIGSTILQMKGSGRRAGRG